VSARPFCYQPLLPKNFTAIGVATVTSKVLADDLKQVVRGNGGADASAQIGKVFDESAAMARQGANERGDAINIVPSEKLKKWQEATEAAPGKRAEDLDGRGLKSESLVGKARELLAEYDTAN
jgi:hypothetical protein